MIADIPLNEYQIALDRCASDILWEAAIDAPPVNCFRLAERIGMKIARDENLSGRARFVRLRGGRETIFLGKEDRKERRHWSVAHEVGEALSHRVFGMLGVQPPDLPPASRELIANELASRLLLPRRWFQSVCHEYDSDLEDLKKIFSTASYELIARRLLDFDNHHLTITLFDQGGITWRRTNLGSVGAPHSVEWQCQRHAYLRNEPTWAGTDTLVETGLLRVRCWPIHENGWRREIVISEPELTW